MKHWLAIIGFSFCLITFASGQSAARVTSATPILVSNQDQWFMANSQYNVVMHITITAEADGDTLSVLGVLNDLYSPAAQNGSEIVNNSVRLWYMPVDTGNFSTSTAQFVKILPYDSGAWYDLAINLPVGDGSGLYITADIPAAPATPGAICAFYVYQNTIAFASGETQPSADLPVFPETPPTAFSYISDHQAASGALASHQTTSLTIVSTGQSILPLDFTLQNIMSASPPFNARVFLSGITITVRDQNNNIIAPDRAISQIGLIDPDQPLPPQQTVSLVTAVPSSATGIYLPLAITIPATDQHLRLFASVSSNTDTVVSEFRLCLDSGSAIDAMDEYSRRAVPITPAPGDAFPMRTNLLTVFHSATNLNMYHTPILAPGSVVLRGQTDVNPMNLTFVNPGNSRTSRVDVTRVTLAVTDGLGNTMLPSTLFSRVAITGGVLFGETKTLSSTSSLITIPLSSSYASVPAYQPLTVSVMADILPEATGVEFRLSVAGAAAIQAQDANTTKAVTVQPAYPGDPFPMTSPNIRIASSFNLAGRSLAPQTLYPEQRAAMLLLTFTHPGPADVGTLLLQGITITAQDQSGVAVSFADVCTTVYLTDDADGTLVAQANPTGNGSTLFIAVPDFPVLPLASRSLRLEILTAATLDNTTLRLLVTGHEQLTISQPSDPTRPVFVAGLWPLQSQAASLGGGTGELRLSNYPNPFAAGRESTRIAFYLANPSTVTITCYTLLGDPVIKLLNSFFMAAGPQEVVWDGRTGTGGVIKNGVYLLKIEVVPSESGNPITQLRKVAVIK